MCGIAGIYSRTEGKADPGLLKKMCDAMRHRGPNDEGYYIDGNVGLSMRRLSVIDLHTGKQPIHNEDKTVWIVFNGEIYNFRDLRTSLEDKHRFYTNTDTEVIVHLYEEYGEKFVTMLNGMFTFAIWDSPKKTLFVGRDRLGIKPLYYTEANGNFIFASEIKSILEVPYVIREVDPGALDSYFSFLYTPAPLTMFKGIRKLMPGHMMVWKDGHSESIQYWEMDYTPRKETSLDSLVDEFRVKFGRAVKSQLISDVSLGAFLSGGIDSSAIVANMAEYVKGPVETFSIGYGKEEAYYDESEDAKIIAGRYGTNHHSFILRPDVLEILPEVVRSMDEPLADSSVIPNYYLCQQTRKHVTVALSGLGGDELCGGYPRYAGMYLADFYRRIPRVLREKIISGVVLSIPDSSKGRRFVDRAKRFVKSGALPLDNAYFNMISAFDRENKRGLLRDAAWKEGESSAESIFKGYFCRQQKEVLLNKVFFTDMKLYLVDDLLTLTDKMSMAHSLEVRVPFLDNDLVEFMAGIPPELKVRRLTKKYLLKKSLEGILPKKTLYKEKKGFSVPLTLWFRNDLRGFLDSYLSDKRIDRLGYFNRDYVRGLIKRHFNREGNYFSQIWSILVFSLWHSTYIEGKEMEEDGWKDILKAGNEAL